MSQDIAENNQNRSNMLAWWLLYTTMNEQCPNIELFDTFHKLQRVSHTLHGCEKKTIMKSTKIISDKILENENDCPYKYLDDSKKCQLCLYKKTSLRKPLASSHS